MKMRISSWVYAAVFLLAGAYSFVIFPKFHAIYKDLYGGDTALSPLTKFVLGVTPLGWFAFACTLVALAILRDVLGRPRSLPSWAALGILLASAILVVVALFLPLIVDIGTMESR